MKRTIWINEKGFRVGEDHHNAKLTNREVALLLELRDEGWTYKQLGVAFEISKSGARNICTGRTRCQTLVLTKTVHVLD